MVAIKIKENDLQSNKGIICQLASFLRKLLVQFHGRIQRQEMGKRHH